MQNPLRIQPVEADEPDVLAALEPDLGVVKDDLRRVADLDSPAGHLEHDAAANSNGLARNVPWR